MKFNNEGELQLTDQKFKLIMMIEIDVIADLIITPVEIVDRVRQEYRIKKSYEGFLLENLTMEFEVHNEENNIDLLEV
jgi:hypothetical protein